MSRLSKQRGHHVTLPQKTRQGMGPSHTGGPNQTKKALIPFLKTKTGWGLFFLSIYFTFYIFPILKMQQVEISNQRKKDKSGRHDIHQELLIEKDRYRFDLLFRWNVISHHMRLETHELGSPGTPSPCYERNIATPALQSHRQHLYKWTYAEFTEC